MIRRAVSFAAMPMPEGRPIRTAKSTDTIISASVWIARLHRPSSPIRKSVAASAAERTGEREAW